jgi:hypothetical protein
MDYRWSAPDALLADIQRLAREHGLVFYDPQGSVVLDPDEVETEYVADTREVLRVTLILLGALVVAVGAWYASITVVSWLVIVVTGFLAFDGRLHALSLRASSARAAFRAAPVVEG